MKENYENGCKIRYSATLTTFRTICELPVND